MRAFSASVNWGRPPGLHGQRVEAELHHLAEDLLGPRSLGALAFSERHSLALLEILEPHAFDAGPMEEEILPASGVYEPKPASFSFLMTPSAIRSIAKEAAPLRQRA